MFFLLKIYCWGLNVCRLLFFGSNQNVEYTWPWFLPCSSGVWIYKTQQETPCFGDSAVQNQNRYHTWLCRLCLFALNILKKNTSPRRLSVFLFLWTLAQKSRFADLCSPVSSVKNLAPIFIRRSLSVQSIVKMLQCCGCFSLGLFKPESRRLMFYSLLVSFGLALPKCREWQIMFFLFSSLFFSKIRKAQLDGCAFFPTLGISKLKVSTSSPGLPKSINKRQMFWLSSLLYWMSPSKMPSVLWMFCLFSSLFCQKILDHAHMGV